MPKFCVYFLFLLSLPFVGFGQNSGPPSTLEQLEEAYQRRIQKETLYGVYIPADLADAFVQLHRRADKDGLAKFKALSERQSATVPFFGLGRWIAHNWGFYGGSRFTVYLNQLNVYHPDDMIRFTLVMFHRHLNEKPLDPRPVVEGLRATRAAMEQDSKLQGEVLHEETRQVERPDSLNSGGN